MARADSMLVTSEEGHVWEKDDVLVNEYPDLAAVVNNVVGVGRLLSYWRRCRVGCGDFCMGKISTGANTLEPNPGHTERSIFFLPSIHPFVGCRLREMK